VPRLREGPIKDKQTGFFYFDQYIGFGDERKRVRISLGTTDLAKAQWLWELEFKKQWPKYYGIESPEKSKKVSFKEATRDFVKYDNNFSIENGNGIL